MSLFKRDEVDESIDDGVESATVEGTSRVKRRSLRRNDRSESVEPIEDDYDDVDRTLSDADAHRDAVYELPTSMKQIWICYMAQMKRFTKERTVWGLLILLALIPAIYLLIDKNMGIQNSLVTNIFIATPLMAMPIVSMFICSNVCGSMLPREYNERTVYLSLPLPMSRFTFYIGKFLAGLTLCWGVITAAYGLSIVLAMTVGKTNITYSAPMFISLMIMMATTFSFCAFVYMLSASSKRGASMKSVLLLIIGLPMLIILLNALPNMESMAAYADQLRVLGNISKYLPVLGPDLALTHLGHSPLAAMMGMDYISLNGFSRGLTGISMDMNAFIMSVIAILFGLLFLFRGFMKIKKRDM